MREQGGWERCGALEPIYSSSMYEVGTQCGDGFSAPFRALSPVHRKVDEGAAYAVQQFMVVVIEQKKHGFKYTCLHMNKQTDKVRDSPTAGSYISHDRFVPQGADGPLGGSTDGSLGGLSAVTTDLLHVLPCERHSAEVAIRPSGLHRSLLVVRHEQRGDVAQQRRGVTSKDLKQVTEKRSQIYTVNF